jgi:hypothetical protein
MGAAERAENGLNRCPDAATGEWGWCCAAKKKEQAVGACSLFLAFRMVRNGKSSSSPEAELVALLRGEEGGAVPFHVVAQDDGLGDFFHGPAPLAALALQSQVGLLFA